MNTYTSTLNFSIVVIYLFDCFSCFLVSARFAIIRSVAILRAFVEFKNDLIFRFVLPHSCLKTPSYPNSISLTNRKLEQTCRANFFRKHVPKKVKL